MQLLSCRVVASKTIRICSHRYGTTRWYTKCYEENSKGFLCPVFFNIAKFVLQVRYVHVVLRHVSGLVCATPCAGMTSVVCVDVEAQGPSLARFSWGGILAETRIESSKDLYSLGFDLIRLPRLIQFKCCFICRSF